MIVKIELTPEEIKRAIIQFLEAKNFKVPSNDVSFDVSRGGPGDRGGYDEPELRSASLTVETP